MRSTLSAITASLAAAAAQAALPPAPPGVAVTTEHGIEFATIGAAGNAPVPASQRPLMGWASGLGAVGREYRLARTELTYAQFMPFLDAFIPHFTGQQFSVYSFANFGITYSGGPLNDRTSYALRPGFADAPIELTFPVMYYYCNWMHNGRSGDAAAFTTGAYDVASIVGSTTAPGPRMPGARFWIPSLDEWTKGMHYDPDRGGPGVGGYWVYPTRSDLEPVGGPPGSGAATGAGWIGAPFVQPVASYPGVQSPWGLLEGSGGLREILEDGEGLNRLTRGAGLGSDVYSDRIDVYSINDAGGLRLAAAVPAPSAGLVVVSMACLQRRRTRR